MELAIYNIKGEDTGRKAQLNDQVFAIDANEHAVCQLQGQHERDYSRLRYSFDSRDSGDGCISA